MPLPLLLDKHTGITDLSNVMPGQHLHQASSSSAFLPCLQPSTLVSLFISDTAGVNLGFCGCLHIYTFFTDILPLLACLNRLFIRCRYLSVQKQHFLLRNQTASQGSQPGFLL